MAEKKSCKKHVKFNYYCDDCQEANRGYQEEIRRKALESGTIRGDNNEDLEFIVPSRDRAPPKRYKYRPLRKRPKLKKYFLYLFFIIVLIALLTIFWWWPSWIGGMNLQYQLYSNKAGNVDFFDFILLNFWSINFFFNKTALLGAIIGCVIMSLPPERNLLTIIGTRIGFGKPSYVKSLAFWWTGGFCLFYLLGHLINSTEQFAWIIYLIENGEMQVNYFTLINDAFSVLYDTTRLGISTIYIYSNLYLPVIYFICGIFLLRLFLNIVNNFYIRRDDYLLLTNVLFFIGIAFIIGFFTLPTLALNGVELIQTWAVVFGFVSFITLGIILKIYGKIKKSKSSIHYKIRKRESKKIVIMGVAVLILITTPLIISAGTAINLNNTTVWLSEQWTKKFNRQIVWTRACAGLDMFEERPIENFSLSSTSTDAEMIRQIRQYDQDFAVQYMAAQIGSTYEGLADSDIVYIEDHEYWVAPKTIILSEITGDAVQTNTEMYDHVEGFLAMDTFTGDLVDIQTAFNISNDNPIFFGERESERFLRARYDIDEEYFSYGAYDHDILLGTEWAGNILKNNYVYEGEPDGKLTGIESFWFTANLGLFPYAVQAGENEFLINRNIKTRVENVLLPNLRIDSDPYLVFDIGGGKMYYAVSIYTYIQIGSYSAVPILRFLGVCLIDVKTGVMSFFENPTLEKTNDPTYPLWQIYLSKYNWQTTPNWLKAQLRYPEELFEYQLAANYYFHVQDSQTWKREDDFHERPEDGDLFYIESDLGDGIEYIGIDLVEYIGLEARLLAGMYVVRHGEHFGEAIFYHTRGESDKLIGPKTARDTYESEATQEFALISGARNGNTLLYPIGGSVYYYVPTYSTAGDLQQLKLAGFVEAFTREVGYGTNALEAYDALDIAGEAPIDEKKLTYSFKMDSTMSLPNDLASFTVTLQNFETDYTADPLNVKVVLTIYTAANVDIDLIVPKSYQPLKQTSVTVNGYSGIEYTLVDEKIYFGEGLTLTGYVEPSTGDVILRYKWSIYVDGVLYNTPQEKLIVVN